MIPGAANPLLLASVQAGAAYNIERSIRLNAPDSAYLSRTPSVAGNRKTWTWAGWVKRSGLGSGHLFVGYVAGNDNQILEFRFSNDQLHVAVWTTQLRVTTQVFRDTSAWAHVVLAVDTTQAVANDRVKLYWNGAQITQFATTNNPAQNADLGVNQAGLHTIGREWTGTTTLNGYLADIHFIDGQALDPTSFGEFDANGVWQPKAYTGSYGTNGFHLPFSDNSTAAALGTDTSGAGNNWTVNNISVAAGAGNDSLVDTPTSYGTDTGAGGEVVGNYCTANPLDIVTGNGLALANGNLDVTLANAETRGTIATPTSGKWYYEWTINRLYTDGTDSLGITAGFVKPGNTAFCGLVPSVNNGYNTAGIYKNGTRVQTLTGVSVGDVFGIALDLDNLTMQVYRNGAAHGSSVAIDLDSYKPRFYGNGNNTGDANSASLNFGQRPFAYPVSGYKALCTTNLPEPQTITTSGSYTGNGVADGPFVYLNGVPTAMTVNGTAVTFGTHADKLSNGFRLRTTSTTYNQNAATYNYSVTSTGPAFKTARAQSN